MRPIRGLAGSSLLALLFAGAALHAVAQTPASPFSTACPECTRWESAVDRDQQELNRLETAVERLRAQSLASPTGLTADGKSIDDLLAAARANADAMRKRLEVDKTELDKCIRGCALRGPLPPPPPDEIAIVPHADPSWCDKCAGYGEEARKRLLALLKAETDYLTARIEIRGLYGWLSTNAGVRDSKDYAAHFGDYYKWMTQSAAAGKTLLQAQEDFAAAMAALAQCNTDRCPKGSLTPPLSPSDFPVAACPDCDHDALVVKALITYVHRIKVDLVELESTISRLPASDSTARFSLEDEKKKLENNLRDAEPNLEKARQALKDCNASCDKKSATGPGTTPPLGKDSASTPPGTPERPVQPTIPRAKTACPACTDKAQRLAAKESELWDLEHAIAEVSTRAQSIVNSILGRKGQTATADEQAQLSELDRQRRGLEPKLKSAKDEAAKLKGELDACKCPPPEEVKPLSFEDTVLPIAPGASPPIVPVGPPTGIGIDTYLALLPSRSYEAPPKDLATDDQLTFFVPNTFLASLVFDKFKVHTIAFDLLTGKVLMGTDPGVDAEMAWSYLQELQQNGFISDLERDPYVAAALMPAEEGSPAKVVHLSGNFGATLLDPVRQRPVAGASIMVGPLSPTPFFNPGERPGDDRPPSIVRTDSSGTYSASLTGVSGPIEISIAKRGDSRTSFAIADGPGNAPPASAGAPATQH